MTIDSSIPWDIINAAKKVAYEREDEAEAAVSSWAGVETVARAIRAERERCAAIAEGWVGLSAAKALANAIRSGMVPR